MSSRLLVVQHQDTCPPGLLAGWCAEAGVELDVLRPHAGDPVPTAVAADGLLVLGGEMGALDDDVAPWLPAVRRLIEVTVDDGTPFLGVCLGHQLAAAGLGGVVTRNPTGRAQGVAPFQPLPEAAKDALLATVAPGSPVVQSNRDVVTELPAAAVPLATSPDGTLQAARFGPRAWGVQCHPEATTAIFRSWTVDKPGASPHEEGVDLQAAVAQVAAHEGRAAQAWAPFGRRFAEIVDAHALR